MSRPITFAVAFLLCFLAVLGQQSAPDSAVAEGVRSPDKNGKWHIHAEGIKAAFIPYGASISNLFIADKNGVERDIVDKQHGHWGAVPGRYANRIKNSTFSIDGRTYHTVPNENDGADTLHGGPDGWDYRNWTVVAHTASSITFSLADPSGKQGFPGEVVAFVTYSVEPYTWNIRMTALSLTELTPIMLSSHTYWNLDGFANPSTPTALNHTLHLPYSGQRVSVDSILIPDGPIITNPQYSVNDFWTAPKQIGANLTAPALNGNCGAGCTGYDTCYLVNREALGPYNWRTEGPVATLASEWSGITLNVYSDQDAFQIYSCNSQNGSLALKQTQGFFGGNARPRVVEQYGCIVMEIEDWIAGIDYPEWGRARKQIFGPDTGAYELNAVYKFSVA